MNGYPDTLKSMDHLRLAEDFYQAFRDLPPRTPPQSWPRYFLLCHAVELALKAYLTYRGKTPKELKDPKIRHSLKQLLSEATNAGLSLSASAQGHIALLNEAHEEFWHRYPREDGKPIYTIDQFEPVARELLDSVAAAVWCVAASTSISP